MTTRKFLTTKTMAKIAILAAIGFILMFLDFSLPFFPPFYKLDFSECAILIGGFALGPLAAVVIEALKILLLIIFRGSNTAYVGECAAFIMGSALCVPAAIYYRRHKTRKGAMIGMVIGTVCLAVAGVITNYLVLLPAYSYFYQMPMDVIIGMGSAIVPLIKDKLTFVLFATLPFNILKGVVVSCITFFVYKRISFLLKK
ncbi:MAG: ECF transporter S component [Erysipelotrichaceae bacterium]|nr:ECF transporter S component [Erysipelotrichaceae bacterium]